MPTSGPPRLLALLLLAASAAAAGSPASTSQDAIVDKFDRYVKTSERELEDLQGMISDRRRTMEHGEEITSGDFQPLPSLGPQTIPGPPTTTTTSQPPSTTTITSSRPPTTTTTTATPWGEFLGGWKEPTSQASRTTPWPEEGRWMRHQEWTTESRWGWSHNAMFPTKPPQPWHPAPAQPEPWKDEWPHRADRAQSVRQPPRLFHRINTWTP